MMKRTLFAFIPIVGALALSGCVTNSPLMAPDKYAVVVDGGYAIPAVPKDKLPEQFRRQIVTYQTTQAPGTIVIDTANHFLYLVMEDNKAMRYGIGVGRDGFRWSGVASIGRKAAWPTWTPPLAMQRRDPATAKFAGGQKPGLDNPLGARALYLYKNGRDSIYRLHGTPEWWTIGTNVSSGCIRLINQDIIDLYNRVEAGTKVVVL